MKKALLIAAAIGAAAAGAIYVVKRMKTIDDDEYCQMAVDTAAKKAADEETPFTVDTEEV